MHRILVVIAAQAVSTCAATVSVKNNVENWDGSRLKGNGNHASRTQVASKMPRKSVSVPRKSVQWLPGVCAVTEFSSRMAVCRTDKSGAWHMMPTADEGAQGSVAARGAAGAATTAGLCPTRWWTTTAAGMPTATSAPSATRRHITTRLRSSRVLVVSSRARIGHGVAASRPTHHPRP
jgi:hypothetical protein